MHRSKKPNRLKVLFATAAKQCDNRDTIHKWLSEYLNLSTFEKKLKIFVDSNGKGWPWLENKFIAS